MTTPTYFYSAQTSGFYLSGMHTDIPDDAVPVSEQTWRKITDDLAQGLPVNPDDLIPEDVPTLPDEDPMEDNE